MKWKISVLLLGAALPMPFGSRVVFAQNAMAKAAPIPIHPEAARELVLRVREQLAALSPLSKKWAIYYEPQSNAIAVESSETVRMIPPLFPNAPSYDPSTQKPVLAHPSFSLDVEQFVSPTDYKRFVAENAAIDTRLGQMQAQMRGISHKFDSYLPRTDHEKRQVDAYNHLRSSRHTLPDFYFQNVSLSREDVPTNYPFFRSPGVSPFAVNDKSPAWEKEQAQVAGIITALVSRYEAPQK